MKSTITRLCFLLALLIALCLSLTACGACEHTCEEWTVTKDATCTAAGERTGTCTQCSATVTEAIDATGHAYGDWTVTREATCIATGERTSICTRCSDIATETVATTGHTADSMVCHVCDEVIISVDSLLPTELLTSEALCLEILDLPLGEQTIDTLLLNIYLTEDGLPFAHGEVRTTDAFGDSTELSLFYEDGIAYAITDKDSNGLTIHMNMALLLEDLLMRLMSDPTILIDPAQLEAIAPYISAVMPLVGQVGEYLTTAFDEDALTALIETLFAIETTDEGSTLTLDLAALKELNAALSEMSIADLIDLAGGEGTFDALKVQLPILLSLNVEDLLTFLELQTGLTPEALDEAADTLIALFYGEGTTVEDLLGLSLSDILNDQTVRAMPITELICNILASMDVTVSADELQLRLSYFMERLEITTLYSLFSSEDIPDLRATVDTVLDALDGMLDLVITVGADGTYRSSVLNFTSGASQLSATVGNDLLEVVITNGTTVTILTATCTPDRDADMAALTDAKAGTSRPVAMETLLLSNGYTPILAEDDVTILGAYATELIEEGSYAVYRVYELDTTASPVLVIDASYTGVTVPIYMHLAFVTEYVFALTPGETLDPTTAEPMSVTYETELVQLTASPIFPR